MPNYIYDITNVQLNPNTYTNTVIQRLNLRNTPWVDNNMVNAFSNCINVISISNIEQNVVHLAGAFSECSNLTTITALPDTCDGVLTDTFRNCRNLRVAPALPSNCTNLRGILDQTFVGCSNLTVAPVIPNWVSHLSSTFVECRSLTTIPSIPNSVISMDTTFSYCTSLTDAPTIPSSVTTIASCFAACSNLVNIPTLPNSITNMQGTFSGCSSLSNIPELPVEVINLSDTFKACTNLTNIAVNSQNIVNLYQTFSGCTNLTDAYIYSNQIANATNTFANRSNSINVYIPYYNLYSTKENSITRNTFETTGYDEQGTLDNVYLKNLTPALTINPIPSTATVQLECDGISSVGSSLAVPFNSIVNWSVQAENYVTRTGSQSITTNDVILDITLDEVTYTVTVIPTPSDATVTLESGSQIVSGTGTQVISVTVGSSVTYTVSKEGYTSQSDIVAVDNDTILTIEIIEEVDEWEFTIDQEDLATLVAYTGTRANVVVPDIVQGTPTPLYTIDYDFIDLGNNEADLTKYNGTETDIEVPEYITQV